LNEASVTSTLPRTDSLAIHLRQAIANAAIQTDPGPYMVVSNLFPDDVYALLLETMPPPEAFEVADRTKANFDPAGTTDVPAQSRDVWLWFHNDVVDGLLTPALFAAFRSSIASAYRAAFGSVLADEALDLQHRAFQGRLMLRRPGYRLKPHRDKKSATLTGLIYFARPGDSADFGTDLYRVENDQEAPIKKTYYPEAHGARTELARSVPFVRNAALVFMNVPGMAHGAGIPPDAPQAARYAYQFYVGPAKSDLVRLVRRLPSELAAAWTFLKAPDDNY
jgi:hypothetical protein